MIAIVRIALQRPLTFIVMAILIFLLGLVAAFRTPVDIFPEIKIPVIAVVWQYNGLPANEMAGRIITNYERGLSTMVNNIEHIESQSMTGMGIVKIYFHLGSDIRIANAQVVAMSQTTLRMMPQGITPPLVLNYNAATVPILQLALSGKGLAENQLFDIGSTQVRPQLATVPGIAVPFPSGGSQRQVQVDIDPQALQQHGLSAQDISDAIAAQNQINPSGFVKLGASQYNVQLNNAPDSITALNNMPVKVVNGSTIYMREVAHVRDGSAPQNNVVHVQSTRSVLLTILKNGATSTLDVIAGVKERLPKISENLPPSLKILLVGDQSVFVKASVSGVIREGAIAAVLTALMILLFLGSWRSTVIVIISIPLSVLAAIAALAAFGETLNVMTLGGLALAVGILVDEATVTIESINWHLKQGKPVLTAIMDGSAQIVTPAFVSLLSICIVFVPMFFLPGVAGYLFIPMALSVVFAMIASFILSRTLVPTMAKYLLQPHVENNVSYVSSGWINVFGRFQRGFEKAFQSARTFYAELLIELLHIRRSFLIFFTVAVGMSFLLVPFLGQNFFPDVDAGQIVMHVRAPIGTRIEETATEFENIEHHIRQIIPAHELAAIADNIGLPNSGINAVYNNSGTIGPQDGDVMISLNKDHTPTQHYIDALRQELPHNFPGTSFAFLPADITSQILNFGAPAPINVQVSGNDVEKNRRVAAKILRGIRGIPGVADARIQQSDAYPQLKVNVDRDRIAQMGLTERDVTNGLGNALAGTSQTQPVFFLNKETNIGYSVTAQMPEYRLGTLDDLMNVPIGASSGAGVHNPQILGGLATVSRTNIPAVISHYGIQPTIDIFATPAHRDLGSISSEISPIINAARKDFPKGVTITMRGQSETMNAAYEFLILGLLVAIMLIYLLIVVNFQSWLDPFVIITALPAALAGIVWMLFITHTSLSVPALTGAIMCMGVATANSILVVSFARERLEAVGNSVQAALEAAQVRFRPVLMTALAMIIGMIPMALGWGEGGEQNAPLGRAVIGGLGFATIATLFFVPAMFSLVHSLRKEKPTLLKPFAKMTHA